jgi:hypothetical protein
VRLAAFYMARADVLRLFAPPVTVSDFSLIAAASSPALSLARPRASTWPAGSWSRRQRKLGNERLSDVTKDKPCPGRAFDEPIPLPVKAEAFQQGTIHSLYNRVTIRGADTVVLRSECESWFLGQKVNWRINLPMLTWPRLSIPEAQQKSLPTRFNTASIRGPGLMVSKSIIFIFPAKGP